MGVIWGIVVIVLSLLAWGGQAISWLSPATAERLSLTESEDTVEPVYHADIRGEALWDTLALWTMVVAGVLLVAGNEAWAYFGLVGGGMYLYFAGRGIVTRAAMQRRGFRIGTAQTSAQRTCCYRSWRSWRSSRLPLRSSPSPPHEARNRK
jgi:hypothetical protein